MALDKYYKKWEKVAAELDDEEAFKNIDPKDISVTLGRPMTEEEFKAYRASQGMNNPPHIISATPKDPKEKLRAKLDAMTKSRSKS